MTAKMRLAQSLPSLLMLLVALMLVLVAPPSTQAQTYTVPHSFTGPDGANPDAALILDAAGNLYGTTYFGGAKGVGTVFKLDKTGKETMLYSFPGGAAGAAPAASLIRDAAGNLYGTTTHAGNRVGFATCGVVFKLAPSGKETGLYEFNEGLDGCAPSSGLARDAAGNLYGTTPAGGTGSCLTGSNFTGCGTVFKLDVTGKELHRGTRWRLSLYRSRR